MDPGATVVARVRNRTVLTSLSLVGCVHLGILLIVRSPLPQRAAVAQNDYDAALTEYELVARVRRPLSSPARPRSPVARAAQAPELVSAETRRNLRRIVRSDPHGYRRVDAAVRLAIARERIPTRGLLAADLADRFQLARRLQALGLLHLLPELWRNDIALARGHADVSSSVKSRRVTHHGETHVLLCERDDWCWLSGPWTDEGPGEELGLVYFRRDEGSP